ncbi:MAG: hypothetical protein CVV27_10825 [Candidatus Melainabacteria bacterium HGW-Melainabacteria-1]|nr:MAG: hypothetical protein CVV27_10825 [Candidatus Melainabacteria bacterium HGW-Melainabacteria-1]
MSTYQTVGLLCAGLMLSSACATYNISPNPNPPVVQPTVSPSNQPSTQPSASPTAPAQPSPTPGWSTVVLEANASNHAMIVAEVLRLQGLGRVSEVTAHELKIRLSGQNDSVRYLQALTRSQVFGFSTLSQKNISVAVSTQRVISNTQDFVNFWREHINALDPVPVIDFNSESVVAVMGEQKMTTGYTTSIESIRRLNGELIVHYQVNAPLQSGVVSAYSPVHLVRVGLSNSRGDYDKVSFEQAL